ncbi:MAG: hypothetical protein GY861_17200 [bacterium]|nr:hypothetical protein [bacterium]
MFDEELNDRIKEDTAKMKEGIDEDASKMLDHEAEVMSKLTSPFVGVIKQAYAHRKEAGNVLFGSIVLSTLIVSSDGDRDIALGRLEELYKIVKDDLIEMDKLVTKGGTDVK